MRPSHVPQPVTNCDQCTAEPHRAPEDMTLSEAEALCEGMKGVVELESDAAGANDVSKDPKNNSTSDSVGDLDYDTACKLLFQNLNFEGVIYKIPDNWKVWCEPSPAYNIDRLISELINRGSKPKFDRNFMEKMVRCPYYSIRIYISCAVQFAKMRADDREKSKKISNDLKILSNESKEISEKIKLFVDKNKKTINNITGTRSLPGISYDDVEDNKILSQVNKCSDDIIVGSKIMIPALENLAEMALIKSNSLVKKGNPGDRWKIDFALYLGTIWREWTDEDPSRAANSYFVRFVKAAYKDIG